MSITITLKQDVMRKTILLSLFLALAFTWKGNSQAVNEPANWPNTNWTLNVIAHTGSGSQDIEADPTTSDHFAYDDNETGSGSHDVIAAESPVIDISAAQSAGENYIVISGDYVFNQYGSNEYLAIEYWDADASAWTLLYQFPNNDTPSAPTNNFCNGTPEHYTASLDISSFTASQLSGFKYRIIYNDNTTGGDGWNWGFCFSSPTLSSTATLYEDPTFTLSEIPDCSNNQFSVDVNVTDLGGASSVTVSDDQGSATQQLSAPGTVTFGPYPDGTDVTFTVTNDDNSNISSTDHIQYYCPPANDDCTGAIDLTVGQTCSNTVGTNLGATDSGAASPSCAYYQGGDSWYKITAQSNIDTLYVETSQVSGSDVHDTGLAIYTGDCSNLNQEACNDDIGGGNFFSRVQLTNVTAGTVYYVRVWEYGNNSFGEFNVCAYAPNLATQTLTTADFSFYPNPTSGIIRWNASQNVNRMQVTNLAGQVLMNVDNPAGNSLDISRLPQGVYLLNVQIGDKQGTYRLIKE